MLRFKLLLICLLLSAASVKADEGMWIPSLLKKYNIKDMKKAGFKLSAEDVYDINKICLKDAILGLGSKSNPTTFTGSGSFISESGLVLTNHHTVVSYLHKHSSEELNYMRDGFYAQNKTDELPAKGLTLARLVRLEDVTENLLKGTESLSDVEKSRLVDKRAKEISKKVREGNHYKVKVKSYFGGTQMFLEVYEIYRDVRIVAMPPLALGKFGGESDNWRWPRQSADFAVLRVYGNANHESLRYSIANEPITPVNHLELSLKGYKEGDFAMVYGFPGSTKQYLTARAVQQIAEVTNYHGIKIREAKMEIISKAMNKNEDLWLKYSDFMAKTSNSLLRWKAELRGIEKLDLVNLKRKEEEAFTQWINSSEELKKKYAEVIPGIEDCVARLDTIEKLNMYVFEGGIKGGNFVSFAGKFDMLNAIASRKNVNEKRLNKELRRLRVEASNFFNAYDLETEKEFLKTLVKLYDENVGDKYKPKPIIEARAKYNGNFDRYIDDAFSNSMFASKEKLNEFLKYFTKEDAKKLQNDPVFDLCLSYFLINKDMVYRQRVDIRKEYGKYHNKYLQAKKEMMAGQKIIADANRSLRVSYGNILGIEDDGKNYAPIAYLNELVEKNSKDPKVYAAPQAYIDTCKKAIKESKKAIPTCFISNSHTTGGNSGSPVLNAKGKIIGLNFDRAGNGLVGDYKYMPELTRHIAVDIRYIRFVLEHQLHADNLLEEWK
ncbi:S46 family peptidase [Marinifilum caeruleilacunae]|uniref:Dipeptidyl-peptidase n=1 Tax=Marinifilum caeruleilacunae TaxID=2499076 RepID=A0ABX1WRE1_9BACT|nr:S46 family peptidase [Marinifilum caeruleilacunae]NOU58664.1 S46 family peptidase [Marinifilum caeruleilacunae]